MQEHFSSVAQAYNEIRTTDIEPVRFVRERLGRRGPANGLDIGTGAGRYAFLLLREMVGLRLTCVDRNEAMLAQAARLLTPMGCDRFALVCADVGTLPVEADSFDCAMTFNAVHHFDLASFLVSARRALRTRGWLFVYTRLPAQNERSIWGRFFPEFAAKEDRLYGLDELTGAVQDCGGFALDSTHVFHYERATSLDRLLTQATSGDYSTFSLYREAEFERALSEFQANLEAAVPDTDDIRLIDENIMLTARAL
jgi:SAM-dependent methyltransferase